MSHLHDALLERCWRALPSANPYLSKVLESSNVSLACNQTKFHVSVQQLLRKYGANLMRKKILMHAQRENLAKHPGICILSGFLFNDNFIMFRNLADRSHRAPGKNVATLSSVREYSSA